MTDLAIRLALCLAPRHEGGHLGNFLGDLTCVGVAGFAPTTSLSRSNLGGGAALGWCASELC